MTPEDLQKLFRDVSELRRVVETLESIDKTLGALSEKLGAAPQKVRDLSQSVRDAGDDMQDALKETTDQLEDIQAISEKMFTSWDKFWQSARGSMQTLGDGISAAADKMSRLGDYGVRLQTSPESLLRGALHSTPFGGFIEMMLNTAQRNDVFSTVGRRSLMGFQQTGGGLGGAEQVRQQGQQIGVRMKDLEESFLAAKEEVQAVYGAMVEGGFKAGQVTDRVTFQVKGFGQTVTEASLGLDKAFQLAAGSSMNFASALTRATGEGLPEMLSLVKDLGMRVGETGMNMQSFVGTIVQASSALRVQGADAKALAGAYMNVQESFKAAMDPRTSQQRVSEMAAGALQGIATWTANMPIGMQGLVGRQVGQRLGIDTSRMDITEVLLNIKTGWQMAGRGAGQSFEREAVISTWQALGNMPPPQRAFAMMQSGASPEMAMALLQAERSGGVDKMFDFTKAKESEQKRLSEAAELQPLNKTTFEKMMKEIQAAMYAIGEVMIGLLGNIATGIVNFPLIFEGSAGREQYSQKMAKSWSYTNKAALRVGDNLGRLVDQLGEELGDTQAGGDLREMFQGVFGGGGGGKQMKIPSAVPAPRAFTNTSMSNLVGSETKEGQVQYGDDTIHVRTTTTTEIIGKTPISLEPAGVIPPMSR